MTYIFLPQDLIFSMPFSWPFTVQMFDCTTSSGNPAPPPFGIVRALVISIVSRPPMIDSVANAVCGTSCPKMIVAPTNGAVSSQMRAHTIVEKAQIFFFSSHTSSVVQVVSMASVDEMAIFETMALHISRATRRSKLTEMEIGCYNVRSILWRLTWTCSDCSFGNKHLYWFHNQCCRPYATYVTYVGVEASRCVLNFLMC